MANLQKKWRPFFFAEKNFRIRKPKISVVNSVFFSAKKKVSIFLKVRRLGSQVHQKLFKSARILSGEKNLKLGTPIEIATWRQQDQALWGLWSGPCCLDSSEEVNCPFSNIHNFRSFASIELISNAL